MKINRSSILSFKFATDSKKESVANLLLEYAKVVNYFINKFHNSEIKKSKLLTSVLFYGDLDTYFGTTMRQQSAREALDMLSSMKRKKTTNKKIGLPVHHGNRMCLTSQSVEIQESKNNTFDKWLHMHSIGNKQILDIPLKFHKHFNRLNKQGKLLKSFTITKNSVQLCFEIETGSKITEGNIIGIDTGINALATISNGNQYGKGIRTILEKIDRKRYGSKKQKRARVHLRQYLNETAKELLINESPQKIILEKLIGIKYKSKERKRSSKKMRCFIGAWSYRYWLARIKMNCETNRISYTSVSPMYTSMRCNACGHTDKGNRNKEIFLCLNCGHTNNADVNASKNILHLFTSGAWGYDQKGQPRYGTTCKNYVSDNKLLSNA